MLCFNFEMLIWYKELSEEAGVEAEEGHEVEFVGQSGVFSLAIGKVLRESVSFFLYTHARTHACTHAP